MADTKASALTELTAPELTDRLYIVDDPGGTPSSKTIEIGNLLPQKTTAQMNGISPAVGERPVLYNTDEEEIFFWNGTDWISLVDGLPEG